MLLFQGDSPAVAEAFARADPYVKNGIVTRWRVRRWTTVVGPLAAEPVVQRSACLAAVAPAQAGAQGSAPQLDPGLRSAQPG
ncbi:MAG: hypothetical protein BroJett031_31150 [Betaproteobacteria bacterium]|nr:MAG: hypothetical protein BroJett031_31150 [Betaproteobacteria bacterium]